MTSDDFLTLERRLWTGGPDAYRELGDEQCLVAFTGMAGVLSREQLAATVQSGPRWNEPTLQLQGFLQPRPDFAVVTYRARATRGADDPYEALVTSGYVRRGEHWKLSFHQQTPKH